MKTKIGLHVSLPGAAWVLLVALAFTACTKNETSVAPAYFKVGASISDTTTGGTLKGTMLSGKTYRIKRDIVVNANDTLVIQPGAKIYFAGTPAGKNAISIIVHGSFLSLGSQEKPIYLTVEGQTKTDVPGQDASTDPAYKGLWGGILGDVDTKYMIIKWTHIEFGCGPLLTSPVSGISNGNPAYMVSFVNPDGVFVLEDSWVYGGVDDPIRLQGGKINVMRNTFEKGGLFGGESLNVKSGTVGNYAYNVTIGSATNGPKASNKGGKNPQTNIYMYNNTIVNSGYRRNADGRGGSLNFEEGAKGVAYNNIVVNCKYGLRILTAPKGGATQYSGNPLPPADFANIAYGYNLYYNDAVAQANQIYPIESGTGVPTGANSDIPSFTSLGISISATYPPSAVAQVVAYDGTKAVQAAGTNPKFVNFTLPFSGKPGDIAYATGFDFRLQAGSPAIGKGFTGFNPLTNLDGSSIVPLSETFGSSGITPPSKDLGAYPMDGSGNKH
ncbi:hypothetical protein WSM22_35620 [Cytophagales bacterium WSM2-2]|nr:hypothetical protein WSM22_35620 [Cytophagales bacterium WSM2-2]